MTKCITLETNIGTLTIKGDYIIGYCLFREPRVGQEREHFIVLFKEGRSELVLLTELPKIKEGLGIYD